MSDSPIDQLLAAIDKGDVEAAMALLAPDARLLIVDGRDAEGTAAVRELLASVLSDFRSSTHRVTAQWHVDDTWIAEVDADYVLQDRLELTAVPRAIVAREAAGGIVDLRVYGAHERPLAEHPTGEEWGSWIRGRWIPPL